MLKQCASDPDSKSFGQSVPVSQKFGQTDDIPQPGAQLGSSQVAVQTKNSAVRRLTTA